MKNFIFGFFTASFFGLILLSILSLKHIREYREVESNAYSEAHRLKQHNNLLKSENQNLDRLNRKLRRVE